MSELRKIFSDDWCGMKKFLENVLKPIFGDYEEGYDVLTSNKEVKEKASQANIEEIKHSATFDFFGSELKVFDVTVGDSKKLANSRVGIQTVIRQYINQFEGALIIFHYKNVLGRSWRFSYVERTTNATNTTSAKRYTYILGKNQPTKTITERFSDLIKDKDVLTLADLTKAFSIGSISDDFFDEYKVFYEDFVQFITGNRYVAKTNGYEKTKIHKPNKPIFDQFIKLAENQKPEGTAEEIETLAQKFVRDYIKKLMGRLVFLQFLQKKGWMGVPKNERYGEGDKNFLQNLYLNSNEKDDFLDKVLEPLFFDTLNSSRDGDIAPSVLGKDIKIPYLNGGLFEKDKVFDDTKIAFPKELFSNPEYSEKERVFAGEIEKYPYTKYSGLLDFFGRYNFTIDETDSDEQEIGVDPEMLGKIFENLLEDNKDKGAFYTPKEIVQYMCRESLISYLEEKINNKDIVRAFVQNPYPITDEKLKAELSEALLNIKICDPAIGSGAFPMGMLNELFNCLYALIGDTKSRADLKKHIVKNNIYGVDIEKGAIDIARLRFWLAIIVDEELKGDEVPEPLPNLDYKFMQGNSLLESYNGFYLTSIAEKDQLSGEGKDIFEEWVDPEDALREQKNIEIDAFKYDLDCYFDTNDHARKYKLQSDINDFVKRRVLDKLDFDSLSIEDKIDLVNHEIFELTTLIDSFITKDSDYSKKKIKALDNLKEKKKALEKELKSVKSKQTKAYSSELDPTQYFLWHTWFNDVFSTKGGFDVVIANPPYIRQERLGHEYKELLTSVYPEVGNGIADIYVYFFGLALKIAKKHGVICYITLNKYLKTKYGKELRNTLRDKIAVDSIIDFFELPVFSNASTDAAITKIINDKIDLETRYFPIKTLNNLDLMKTVEGPFLKTLKNDSEWQFVDSTQENVITKIYKDTQTLKEFVNDKIFSGIKTGLNKAFILKDKTIVNKLLNSESSEIIKKYAQSTDIQQWTIKNKENYFLATGFDIDIKNKYPTALSYLDIYKKELIARGDKGREYYNLRSCAYYEDFEKPKIIYIHTAKDHQFYFDTEGYYINNSCYMIITDSKFLFCFLNSKLFKYFKKIKFVAYGDGQEAGRCKLDYNKMITVPIKKGVDEKPFIEIVDNIQYCKKNGKDTKELENRIDEMIYDLYKLTPEERDIVNNQ